MLIGAVFPLFLSPPLSLLYFYFFVLYLLLLYFYCLISRFFGAHSHLITCMFINIFLISMYVCGAIYCAIIISQCVGCGRRVHYGAASKG